MLESSTNGAVPADAAVAREGVPGPGAVPDPELVEQAKRRSFTAEYKARVLAEADALLFRDFDSEQRLAPALDLIARLLESERLSAQNCAELREHLCGCGPLPAGA
jgi:hypothetical protein